MHSSALTGCHCADTAFSTSLRIQVILYVESAVTVAWKNSPRFHGFGFILREVYNWLAGVADGSGSGSVVAITSRNKRRRRNRRRSKSRVRIRSRSGGGIGVGVRGGV